LRDRGPDTLRGPTFVLGAQAALIVGDVSRRPRLRMSPKVHVSHGEADLKIAPSTERGTQLVEQLAPFRLEVILPARAGALSNAQLPTRGDPLPQKPLFFAGLKPPKRILLLHHESLCEVPLTSPLVVRISNPRSGILRRPIWWPSKPLAPIDTEEFGPS